MQDIKLRPYQSELIQNLRFSLRDNDKIIAVLPTGGGKTFTFSFMVRSAWQKGLKVLIITDRIELISQAGGSLKSIGLQPIAIEAGKNPSLKASLYTAMSETLNRRLAKPDYQEWLKSIDLVIIDECHKRSFTKLMPFFKEAAKVIGFTATPVREGKKDQLAETYTDIVQGVEIEFLVKNGYLAKPNYYGVKADLNGIHTKRGDYDQNEVAERFSKTKLYRGVVENWKKRTPDTKTIVFSSNINNSLEIVEEFKSVGVPVRHLDSNMSKGDRDRVLRWFKNTPNSVLSNVGILTTGFDEPSIETVILYRATKSLSLYLQMVGRGSRVIEGVKTEFNILDFGNNIMTHGFWHEPRSWDLDIKKSKDSPKGEAVLKNCPNCEAFIPASAIVCSECGHEDKKEKKKQEFAELQLLNPRELRRLADRGDIDKKVELAKNKLVNPYYVLHGFRKYEDVLEFVEKMEYSKFWLEKNHHRFWFTDKWKELNEPRYKN